MLDGGNIAKTTQAKLDVATKAIQAKGVQKQPANPSAPPSSRSDTKTEIQPATPPTPPNPKKPHDGKDTGKEDAVKAATLTATEVAKKALDTDKIKQAKEAVSKLLEDLQDKKTIYARNT